MDVSLPLRLVRRCRRGQWNDGSGAAGTAAACIVFWCLGRLGCRSHGNDDKCDKVPVTKARLNGSERKLVCFAVFGASPGSAGEGAWSGVAEIVGSCFEQPPLCMGRPWLEGTVDASALLRFVRHRCRSQRNGFRRVRATQRFPHKVKVEDVKTKLSSLCTFPV